MSNNQTKPPNQDEIDTLGLLIEQATYYQAGLRKGSMSKQERLFRSELMLELAHRIVEIESQDGSHESE